MPAPRIQWKIVIGGFVMLLCAAFVDNARGPMLPLFKEIFDLSYTQTSAFLVVGYFAAISCTFLLLPLLNRWGERNVCNGLCGIGILAVLYAGLVESYQDLLFLGLLLGFLVATFGTMCNVLIIRGARPGSTTRTLCALHTMYGAGSFLAPVVLTLLLNAGYSWKWLLCGLPPLFIALILYLLNSSRTAEFTASNMPEPPGFRLPHLLFVFTMAFYVGGEVIVSSWMTSYLVSVQHLRIEQATPYLGGFFAVMALSRLACMLFLRPKWEWWSAWGGLILGLSFFALGKNGYLWGFVLAGLLGPFFPVLFGKMSAFFPTQWRAVTVYALVGMQVMLGSSHFLMGFVTDWLGMQVAYWSPAILFVLAGLAMLAFIRLGQAHRPATRTAIAGI